MNKFLLIPTSVAVIAPLSLINFGSTLNNEIVLATYQSYISDSIASKAYDQFSLKTIYFENDKEVFSGFASGAFDLAIVSSSTLEEAVDKNLVKKIDWERFQSVSEKLKESSKPERLKGKTENQYNFGSIYSSIVNRFFSNSLKIKEYGIPYFLSFLVFAYRGEELKNKEKENEEKDFKSWAQLIRTISKDKRFKPENGIPKLGLIEDELTIFSLSKLSTKKNSDVESEKQEGKGNKKENKIEKIEQLFQDKDKNQSEEELYNQFRSLTNAGLNSKMGSNALFLSPDSAELSQMLSDQKLEGAFMYNGDALYTFDLMKDEGEEEGEDGESEVDDKNWPKSNYDFLRYTPTLKQLQEEIKEELKGLKKMKK